MSFSSLCRRGLRSFQSLLGRPRTREQEYSDHNRGYFAGFFTQERMLADKPRMDFYHAAIARHVHAGDRVVDLGTGTGILAAFAARAGAARVYALDHSTILEHARTLAVANGVKTVEFVATHSKDFTVAERVDVILHEQMGDCLFDEAMIPNVCDLRDRVLKPGGRILPARFEFYCEPIQVGERHHVPFIWELNVHGYDYSSLERLRPQDPGYYRRHASGADEIARFLGEPDPVLTFDLHTVTPDSLPRSLVFRRTITTPGRLDGYAVYFRTLVDDDLLLSTRPQDTHSAPHWNFRILRTDRDDFIPGEIIEITLRCEHWHDLDSWRWSHVKKPSV
jgi:protein arginine N-methyltransferase 1